MYTPLKRIKGLQHRYGGERHAGWLPEGAATPLPTPIEDVVVELEIVFDGDGYLFICRASKIERCFDNWYETLEQAFECGYDEFGVTPADWEDVSATRPG